MCAWLISTTRQLSERRKVFSLEMVMSETVQGRSEVPSGNKSITGKSEERNRMLSLAFAHLTGQWQTGFYHPDRSWEDAWLKKYTDKRKNSYRIYCLEVQQWNGCGLHDLLAAEPSWQQLAQTHRVFHKLCSLNLKYDKGPADIWGQLLT